MKESEVVGFVNALMVAHKAANAPAIAHITELLKAAGMAVRVTATGISWSYEP